MSVLVAYGVGCADILVTELPESPESAVVVEEEGEKLLHCDDPDDCERCSRKRRKTPFDAYPNNLPASAGFLSRQSLPPLKGIRLLVALFQHISCCARSRRRYKLLTRYRYHKQKKPFSSISVAVEQLTSETYDEEDLAGIPDILESIKLQATGPTEAARAIRKKLKYGSVHRQLRALTILDGLLQNGPQRMQRTILSDGPLLERLRIAAVDQVSDPDVRAKCKDLFSQWVASSTTSPGLEGAKSLYNQLPKRAKTNVQRQKESRVLRETEEEAHREQALEEEAARYRSNSDSRSRSNSEASPSSPNTLRKTPAPPIPLGSSGSFLSSFKDKKSKKNRGGATQTFDLNREKPQILQAIASASVSTTNLNNALKLVNRESHRVSEDPEVAKRFETCKSLRRQILRYIHYVEQEEFLGGLIHANEELVGALMAFEVLDKSVDDDSDSEMEEAVHLSRQQKLADLSQTRDAEKLVAGLSLRDGQQASPPQKPPRPGGLAMPRAPPVVQQQPRRKVESESESDEDDDDDDDDPFADSNATKTPDWKTAGRKGYFKEV